MSTNVIKQTLMGEPGSQTIKMVVRSNERGATGPQGDPGEAATISAGTAYSVPAGRAPAVMNTGTSSAAVFDFYIPKGEKGDTGEAPILMTNVDPGEGSPLEDGHFIAVYSE